MANPRHVEILKQGAKVWNEWRRENREITPDLESADLRQSDLRQSDLRQANLNSVNLISAKLGEANLSGANLISADLHQADLTSANLNRANLYKADLYTAHLNYANLSYANLDEANLSLATLWVADLTFAELSLANLSSASLSGANLSSAILRLTIFNGNDLQDTDWTDVLLSETILTNLDLSTAKGLDTTRHFGPSSVGYETLLRNAGKVPNSFWRGCGVPQDMIDYLPAFATDPLNFQSCFISFNKQDKAFATKLHDRMQEAGLNVWFAPKDMPYGQKLHEEVFRAIHVQERLLVILSEHSLKSNWVISEIRRAHQQEVKSGVRKLFPIRLVSYDALEKWECFDADTGKDLAAEIRQYLVPDLSDWADDAAFEANFQKLLKALNPNALRLRTRQAGSEG